MAPVQGFPVVISDTGAPFVSVTERAPLATVATNGRGTPVRLVSDGAPPLIIQGLPDPIDFGWQAFTMTTGSGPGWVGYSDGEVKSPSSGSISQEPTAVAKLLTFYDDTTTLNLIAIFDGLYLQDMDGLQVSIGGFVLTSDDVRDEMGNTHVRFPDLPGTMNPGETYEVVFGFNL